jgi:hypothetical protein
MLIFVFMKKNTDSDQLTAHLQKLPLTLQPAIDYLRKIILSVDSEISEHIKWNSPAFYYSGAMKDFDPKTYKRDLIVLNLRNEKIMCVLPTGMNIKNNIEIFEGAYADGRRIINFKDLADIKSKEEKLIALIKEWLECLEKL